MAKRGRSIEIVIEARDAASGVLKHVEKSVRGFGSGTVGARGGGVADTTSNFERMAGAALRMGAAIQIANVGMKLFAGTVSAVKGDYAGMELMIRRLPLGIGEITGTVADWGRGVIGPWREVWAMMEKLKKRAAAEDLFGKTFDRLRAIQKTAREEITTSGMSATAREFHQLQKQYQARVMEIERMRVSGSGVTAQQADKALAEVRAAFDAGFMDMGRKAAEKLKAALPTDKQLGIRLAPTIESRFLERAPGIGRAAEVAKKSDEKLARLVEAVGQQRALDAERNTLLGKLIAPEFTVVEISG